MPNHPHPPLPFLPDVIIFPGDEHHRRLDPKEDPTSIGSRAGTACVIRPVKCIISAAHSRACGRDSRIVLLSRIAVGL